MRNQRYIGIENELISFKENEIVSFDDYFKRLRKERYFSISDKAIRTDTGNGYYVDGAEIEILTPPIPINKSFASRLTDSLMIGRNYVIENTPNLKHTGYSMHWNITKNGSRNSFGQDIAIPFQLFGLTPLSVGSALRDKENEGRFELLGDSLKDESQINATALLLGAYALIKEKYDFPIKLNFNVERQVKNIVKDGRYSFIDVYLDGKKREMQVQNFVELFYDWLSPFVYKLGDTGEIKNLESFIKGEKKLEMDDFKYFYLLTKMNGKKGGTYNPLEIRTPNGFKDPILKVNPKRKIPLEGKLWGNFVSNKDFSTSSLTWDKVILSEGGRTFDLSGIDAVYRFSSKNSSLRYSGTTDLPKIKPKDITREDLEERLDKKMDYNPDEDNSGEDAKKVKSFSKYFQDFNLDFLKKTGRRILTTALICGALSSAGLFLFRGNIAKKEAEKRIEKYLEKKSSNQENIVIDSMGVRK